MNNHYDCTYFEPLNDCGSGMFNCKKRKKCYTIEDEPICNHYSEIENPIYHRI